MSDISSLKQKSIIEYLDGLGIKPKSTHGRTFKYLSPWRGEKEPSLHVYPTNTWNDFGEGCGGSIIELVQKLHNVGFVEALRILEGNNIKTIVDIPQAPQEPPIKILWETDIKSEFLISYLKSRCISIEVARMFCKQVRVELKGKDDKLYRKTMLSFPSNKGGLELRNRYSKIGTSPKYYSSINDGMDKCLCWEGFFDLLSFVEIYGKPPKYTLISLNSASFADYVDWSRFKEVVYCGDSDTAGDKVLAKISAVTPTKDIRHIFYPCKDLNEWLIKYNDNRSEFINKKLL